jgi:subtilisin-like proprotein convertase family protein
MHTQEHARMNRLLSRGLVALSLALSAAQAHGQVVISQVWGGGNNVAPSPNADFVDLFNKGSTPVNLAGWSVQVASATGTSWQVVPLSGTIPPGGYYLVQLESAGSTGTVLPVPVDAGPGSITSGNLSSTSGKVALLNTTTPLTIACPADASVQDFVGYGTTANCREGGSTTTFNAPGGATTGSGISIRRKNGGCTDTNVNSADWETLTPSVARNSLMNGFAALTGNSVAITAGGGFTVGVSRDASLPCSPLTGPLTSATADTSSLIGGSAGLAMTDGGGGVFSLGVTSDGSQSSGVYTIPLTVSDGTTTVTIDYRIRIIGPPPTNDQCTNAAVLTTALSSITVDNSTATADVDPGTCNTGTSGNFGVWYVFTPATSGAIVFDETSAQDIASGLWVVPGSANPATDCGTFTSANGLCLSAETWAAKYTAGASYYLQVGASSTTAPTVPIAANLTWITASPANDECSSAEVIPSASAWPLAFAADNRFATDDAIDTCSTTAGSVAPGSVWYSFTPASSGLFVVSETSAQDVAIAIWDVAGAPGTSDCAAFTGANALTCTTSESAAVSAVVGHTYYIMFHSELPSPLAPTVALAGNFSLIPAPANDNCSSAEAITTLPFTSALMDHSGAADDLDANPSCDNSSNVGAHYGVWWSYTASADGAITVARNSPSSEDTVTSVWTGSCGSLTQVNCVDADNTAFFTSVTAGQTYYILVSRYSTTTLTVSTTVGITVNFIAAPPNDTCANAIDVPVPGAAYSQTVDPRGAGADTDMSCNSTSAASTLAGVWHRIAIPAGGDDYAVTVGETGSTDTARAVFAAGPGGCSSLSQIYCTDTETANVVVMEAGKTYYVLTGAFSATTQPTVNYVVTVSSAAATSACCNTTANTCTVISKTACATAGGVWHGPYSVTCSAATASANVCQPAPANDTCAGAIGISGTLPQTFSTPFPAAAGDDLDATCNSTTGVTAVSRMGVWYSFTTGADSGVLRLNETGSNDVFIQQYSGACGSLTPISCTDPEANVDFSIPANTTRYFLMGLVSNTGVPTAAYSLTAVSFTAATGACCNGTSCSVITQSACTGYFLGINSSCSGGPQAAGAPNAAIADFVSPNPGSLTQTLNVSGVTGSITSVEVSLDISHTFVGDLRVQLQGPGGTTADLSIRPRTTGTGCTTTGAQTNNTGTDLAGVYTFTDAAAQSIFDAVAASPTTLAAGAYKAASCGGTAVSLNSIFAAENPNGVWTLSITDNAAGDTGTLRNWSITINGGSAPPCSLVGACCVGSTCSIVASSTACSGAFTPGTTTCAPTTCTPSGVCCRGATCTTAFTTEATCLASGPALQPGASHAFVTGSGTCNGAGITTSPCCYANYNHNPTLEVQDIFDFLNDWFAGKLISIPGGDGASGTLAVQNIFDFLNAWFAGGCN